MAEQAMVYRIWPEHMPFRKDGTPVVGNMGSSIRRVVIIEAETWGRMCAEIPELGAAQFEVPS